MRLQMLRDRETGVWSEQIICEVCDKPITELMLAVVVWYESGNAGTASARVVHKGLCDRAITACHHGEHNPCMEFTHVIHRLHETAQQQQEAVNDYLAKPQAVAK